jgi:uncharacterized protein (TIGR03435 family)
MKEYVDHPLVDQTGLKGRYDFTLKYTYDETQAPTDGSAPPNLFTAIQEQVGLKLEPVKAPADVLVVDVWSGRSRTDKKCVELKLSDVLWGCD